jgi:hypothetical protein
MYNFKLFLAIMFALTIMQLDAASDSFTSSKVVSTTITRSRTASKELMDRLSAQTAAKALLPHIQLAGQISNFVRSPEVVGIRNAKTLQGSGKLAVAELIKNLNDARTYLEVPEGPLDIYMHAHKVQEEMNNYKLHSSCIRVVVHSQAFTKLEEKCQEVLSGFDR